ncbi:hypothetical protein 1 [Hubei tombus-like virus 17]|uniref:hypothetical protein 1 n=1 Tax=Hubei tombus-like virus 17 TaxID=1923263 RepID=UPI00090A97B8|nr:hypothetical protein 1 [Hubei tombus-like virus 17]APG76329.1 hypothetical protein 1 [Hubei tombus-like virus 17]
MRAQSEYNNLRRLWKENHTSPVWSEEDLPRLFRLPRNWRRRLRLPRPRFVPPMEKNHGYYQHIICLMNHHPDQMRKYIHQVREATRPEEVVCNLEQLFRHRPMAGRICYHAMPQEPTSREVATNTITPGPSLAQLVQEKLSCPDFGEDVKIPGIMTWLKMKGQILRHYQRLNLNKIHHQDLYWHLKMHSFGLPRTDNLLQVLRQRAIRYLELQKCNHTVKEHAQVVAYVVTQAMILTEDEVLLQDIIKRQNFPFSLLSFEQFVNLMTCCFTVEPAPKIFNSGKEPPSWLATEIRSTLIPANV